MYLLRGKGRENFKAGLNAVLMKGAFCKELTVIRTIPGISKIECAAWCTEDTECKSFNYEKKTGTCQLSNTTTPTCGALTALAGHIYPLY